MKMKKIIGMIHLLPLLGCKGYRGMGNVIKSALRDAVALKKGGVDAILIENTEDHPHTEFVSPGTIAAMTAITKEVIKLTNLPVGVCVLWNDYRAALSIAKTTGAKFVRIPVFCDKVKTSFGVIEGKPGEIVKYREAIDARNVKILADIQVKHAKLLNVRPIEESAREALRKGADELVITGRFTGDPPKIKDLIRVRRALPNAIINVGSGTNLSNICELAKYADNFIIGTYLKSNGKINKEKVKKLIKIKKTFAVI